MTSSFLFRSITALVAQSSSPRAKHRQPTSRIHLSQRPTMSSSKSADESTVPVLKNLTIENITENVHRINSQCSDPRLRYVMERLVTHLHDFARETRLSFDEWMTGIQFLTQVGQICSDVRQVWIPFLLSLLQKPPS